MKPSADCGIPSSVEFPRRGDDSTCSATCGGADARFSLALGFIASSRHLEVRGSAWDMIDGRREGWSRIGFLPWQAMKKHVLTFGIIGGLLITVLQWTQYRFLVMEHSVEVYAAVIAATFAILGIWLGVRLKGSRQREAVKGEPEPGLELNTEAGRQPFVADEKKRAELGMTPRELEVLELMAQGMSNREIAEKLFVSENTIKTHSSRVFDKLGAKRRTQAVQMGKELGLLP